MPRFFFVFVAYLPLTTGALAATYSCDVKPILDAHCIECHDGVIRQPALTSYPFVSSTLPTQLAIADKILEKANGTSPAMPPGNRPKLSFGEIATIQQWRDGGLQP